MARRNPRSAATPAAEDYLKNLYFLEEESAGPVTTNQVAERLAVAPASATNMLKRLASSGYVRHSPYRGVELTDAGRREALEVIRHHRLIETYLAEALGVPWDKVHDEAEVLEHVLSEDLEERIASRLGHPSRDPHGHPIPPRDLAVVARASVRLDEMEPGERGTVAEVSDRDPEVLRYLDRRGIRPGRGVEAVLIEPFGGSITVEVEGERHAIGPDAARAVRVARAVAR
jgi:DtxR family transcriptional regulator, Mn-dependent transcriptional regulator